MLNSTFKKITTLALCLLPFQAFAEYSSKDTILKLGLETAYYHYGETSYFSGKRLMSTEGPLLGVNADYYHDFDNNYFINVDARALIGVENYKGSLQNGTPHRTGYSTHAQLFEARVTPGFKSSDDLHFYAGLGYRLKADAPSYANRHGYPRQSHYLYMPLGMKVPTQLWGMNAIPYFEYDLLLTGTQITDLTRFKGGYKFSHQQDSGFGVKSGIVFKLNDFDLVPYINYWNIDDSEMHSGIYEPKNTTWEIGVKINFVF